MKLKENSTSFCSIAFKGETFENDIWPAKTGRSKSAWKSFWEKSMAHLTNLTFWGEILLGSKEIIIWSEQTG